VKKIFYILKEMFYMIRQHKLYFLSPILIILALLGFLAYYLGPKVMMAFIYAGV